MGGLIEWIFLATVVLGLSAYVYLIWNFNYWKKRGVKGPKPAPIYGNVPNAIRQKRNMGYDYDDIYRKYKGKERFVGVFQIRNPQLLIIDPKLVREILITNFKNFHDNEFSEMTSNLGDKLLSKNPFMLTGNEWKEKRAEVTPALTGTRVKAVYPVMLEVCDKMTKYLERENIAPLRDGFDGREIAAKFTTEVVSNCIYGLEAGAFSDKRCEIREMGRQIMDPSFITNLYFILLTVIPKITMIWKRPFVRPDIEKFFTDLMHSATEIRKKTKNDRADFLNYLLQLQEKKNLTSLDMAAHTMTFFLDGFETSSVVISHCLHMLGRHKEAQDRLRQEIKSTIAENGEITFEKLNELPYLDQVLNETLRLFNPLIFTSKLCTEPIEVEKFSGEKVQLRKGDIAVISTYSLHRDEEYYPEPEKFMPERFSPENGGVKKYKDMGVFLPFGDGPRICLGMRFALAQVKACIIEMVKNWEISVNKKTRDDMKMDPKQFIFMLEGGIWLDLKRI